MNVRERLIIGLIRALHRVKAKPRLLREHHRQKNAERRERLAEFIRQARSHPCMDCGRFYGQRHMEFDHRPGEIKRFSVGDGKWRTKSKLLKEIAKCDLVCCECHERRETARGRTHGDNPTRPCPNKVLRGLLPELPPPTAT